MKFLRVQDNLFNVNDIVAVTYYGDNDIRIQIRTMDTRIDWRFIRYGNSKLAHADFERIHNELLTLTATP